MKTDIFSWGDTLQERTAAKWMFLIGLGTSTQINIGGYTAISELILVLCLPVLLLKNLRVFIKDRCVGFLLLLVIWGFGQLFSDLYHHNHFVFIIRGLIPPVGIAASLVAIYPLLKKNPRGIRHLLLGMAISSIICIFIFQPGTVVGSYEVQTGAKTAMEARIGYKLFWVSQLEGWLGLLVKGWYLQMPQSCNILLVVFLSVFSLATGGRSAFLIGLLSAVLLFVGGKTREKMLWIRRNFAVMILGVVVVGFAAKFVYQEAATRGLMGENEKRKYFEQSEGRSALGTLMAGRSEFFVALFAIKDHPIIGHGSYAMDYNAYWPTFVSQYGTKEDLEQISRAYAVKDRTIPAHSHVAQFWLWAGIPGLLPWLYILALMTGTLMRRMHVYPPYFGFFAMLIPYLYWHIFFSPFGGRIEMGLYVSAFLFVRRLARQQKLGLVQECE